MQNLMVGQSNYRMVMHGRDCFAPSMIVRGVKLVRGQRRKIAKTTRKQL